MPEPEDKSLQRDPADGAEPCHTQPSLSDGCNRVPFQADEDCDRGNVDIQQFKDLPYCKPIDPTPPNIPPEILDTTWVLPVPPPCSCIDIEYKLDFKGYKDEWKYKYKFFSKGDCCEGEYETDVDFELPCPIEKFGERTFRARMRWNCDQDYEQPYIKDEEDECGIDPQDIDFSLGLPCPINGEGDNKIKVSISWDGKGYDDGAFVKSNSSANCDDDAGEGGCDITPQDVNINIGLPCPIPKKRKKLKAKLEWADDEEEAQQEDSTVIIEREKDDEGVCPTSPYVTLYVEYLPKFEEEPDEIEVFIDPPPGMKDVPTKHDGWVRLSRDPAGFWHILDYDKTVVDYCSIYCEGEGCELDMGTASLDLSLPCPIPEDIVESKKKIDLQWGNALKGDEQPLVVKDDEEDCSVDIDDNDFKLEVPCVVDNNHLKISGSVQVGGDWDLKVKDEPIAGEECSRAFHILLTVPGGGGDSSEPHGASSSSSSSSGSSSPASECDVVTLTVTCKDPPAGTPKDIEYEIGAEPGEKMIRIDIEEIRGWVYVSRLENGKWRIEDYSAESIERCSITCEASSFPSSGSSHSSSGSSSGQSSSGPEECRTVVTGLGFDPSTMCITYTTAEICGRFTVTDDPETKEVCLPTAGHVNKCCGSGEDAGDIDGGQ